MCDFIDCEKHEELPCSNSSQDIFKKPNCYRPLKADQEPTENTPCSSGGSWREHLIGHAKRKQAQAKELANHFEGQGDTGGCVAWNHTAMAYADIIIEIEKATGS